jgi:cytochrome c-type protein NapC
LSLISRARASSAGLLDKAFNTALEVTNTEKFCTSSRNARQRVSELQRTPISQTARVRATCPDRHVPRLTDKIARKMQASRKSGGRPSR